MQHRVLITAGAVYGALDANKIVGNRVRGIWATRFAQELAETHPVTLLVPDIMGDVSTRPNLEIVRHRGYHDYAETCERLAPLHTAAVMAGAVVNWIPKDPYPGKMPTEGYTDGDVVSVPFVFAPRVINRMREWNPNLTLIGCKMLVGAAHDHLVEAAYKVVLAARCNAVVANDMGVGLRAKHLVHQDRTVVTYRDDFEAFFGALRDIIEDEHYRTTWTQDRIEPLLVTPTEVLERGWDAFDAIVAAHRGRFTRRERGLDFVFGAVAVRVPGFGFIVSPREKGAMFSSKDACLVVDASLGDRTVTALKGEGKATLNAPLLLRMLQGFPQARAVLHLHEQLPDAPTVSYAPPGTVRDNDRDIPGPTFNIAGHGFVACLDENLEILR